MSRSFPRWLCLVLILYFFAMGVTGLDRFPKIHEDESWIAAPGYTFWEEGVFGTDLFAGFYGMETHYYEFPPVYSMIVGAGLHLFGFGLFQARLVSLLIIMLVLALTYRLGARFFSPWHGVLAVIVLVSWRIAESTPHLAMGIPIMDMARLVRYDNAVPLFGLSAFALATLQKPQPYHFLFAGIFIGLSALSHFYGIFWFPALLLALAAQSEKRMIRPPLLMTFGLGLVLLPWLLFAASGWQDFLNQFRQNASRFDLLDPQFYLSNLLAERYRYQFVIDLFSDYWSLALDLALLIFGGMWAIRKTHGKILIAVLVALVSLLALLIRQKDFRYLMIVWPLLALVVAAGVAAVWKIAQRYRLRWLLALVLATASLEGVVSALVMQVTARETTPYQTYTDEIAYYLPPGSHVMALQHYWLGLMPYTADYRSILVPIDWTNPTLVENPTTFAEAAQAIPPDILLIDEVMSDFLKDAAKPRSEWHQLGREIRQYLVERGAQLIGEVNDPTYGQCLIYQLKANAQ